MSFLQSPEWEQLQSLLGRKTWRADRILIIRYDFPGGFNYLYCPRPVGITEKFLSDTGRVAKEERSIFLKIDPAGLGKSDFPLEVRLPEMKISNPLQPRKTIILDLQKSEDELLGAMREKTRYNIHLAERHGVTVNSPQSAIHNQRSETFWQLLQDTAERDKFHTHERSYYERLLATKSENLSSELFFAEHQGKILAVGFINFYKSSSVATYLHGASSREHKEVMASHLLHWRIIQEARRRGFRYYDLWGIDEKKWPGLTRFKTGFGGEIVECPPSVDIVYRPFLYGVYSILRKL